MQIGHEQVVQYLACSLLLVSCTIEVASQGPFSAEIFAKYANLVIDLRRNLYAGCVTTLFTSETNLPNLIHSKGLLAFQKAISKQGVQTAVANLRTLVLSGTCQCHYTPSLFVIFSYSEMTRQELKRLSHNQSVSISGPRWLLFLDSSQTIDEFFDGIHVPFDCKFLVAQARGLRMSLTEVYRVARTFPLETFDYGSWSPVEGIKWTTLRLYERRSNLRGLNITATSIHEPPITMLEEGEGSVLSVDGYFGKVWSLLGSKLNFTTQFKKSGDGAWGSYDPATGWNGMIRMIIDREVDVAVTEFWITEERSTVIDYTVPLLLTKYRVIAQNPRSLNTVSWMEVMAPFSAPLWLILICCILILSAFLSLFHHLGRRLGNEEADGPQDYAFYDSLHYVFGVFCHQGHHTTPRAASTRTLYLFAYLTAILLLSTYSAGLISYLTYRDVRLPFSDLEGLLDDGNYRFAVLNKSAEYNIFKSSANPAMQALYTKYIGPEVASLPTTAQEGLARVCNDSYYTFFAAFDIALGAYALGQVECDLTFLPDVGLYAGLSIAMAKNNPYRSIINYNLQAMRDGGLLQRLRALFWPKLLPPQQKGHVQVSLLNVAPMLMILIVGLILATCIGMAERWSVELDVDRRVKGALVCEDTKL